jgi:hypothetical protein
MLLVSVVGSQQGRVFSGMSESPDLDGDLHEVILEA